MRKSRLLLLSVGLMFLLVASRLPAQVAECSSEDNAALLQPTDAAFSDAMELGRSLSDHGFTIRCILTSKLGALFRGLEGAALYRTDRGDFDVLFLSSPQTFADLQIVERQGKKAFIYSFSGKSRVWSANRMESGRREYFLKHDQQLLILDDDQLRVRLQDALNLPKDNV